MVERDASPPTHLEGMKAIARAISGICRMLGQPNITRWHTQYVNSTVESIGTLVRARTRIRIRTRLLPIGDGTLTIVVVNHDHGPTLMSAELPRLGLDILLPGSSKSRPDLWVAFTPRADHRWTGMHINANLTGGAQTHPALLEFKRIGVALGIWNQLRTRKREGDDSHAIADFFDPPRERRGASQ